MLVWIMLFSSRVSSLKELLLWLRTKTGEIRFENFFFSFILSSYIIQYKIRFVKYSLQIKIFGVSSFTEVLGTLYLHIYVSCASSYLHTYNLVPGRYRELLWDQIKILWCVICIFTCLLPEGFLSYLLSLIDAL